MNLTITHSMFIDAPLAPGWYAQGREDGPLDGPYGSEEECERSVGINSHGLAFPYAALLEPLKPQSTLTNVPRQMDIIHAQPWYYQTRMFVELISEITAERDAIIELCDSLQSKLDERKIAAGEPL